jgi:predicted enzyme related to lactoylglutathione lyase
MTIHLAVEHVVIDAHEPGRLASFWSEILQRPIADDWGEFVRLAPDAGGVRIAFAAVPEEKTIKNRVHLDLSTPERETTVERLVEIGATVIAHRSTGGQTWTVMADPEGNEFCVASMS